MANILIVDDELGIRNVLSEILMEAGHQVSAAEDAASVPDEAQPDKRESPKAAASITEKIFFILFGSSS